LIFVVACFANCQRHSSKQAITPRSKASSNLPVRFLQQLALTFAVAAVFMTTFA
jgi:hypothetical protein